MELLIKNPDLKELARKILSGLATEGDLVQAKADDVRAIKCDTGEIHYRAYAGDEIEKKADSPERSKRYIASDETVDRMGDIIRVKGWDLKNYVKNPVALWAHNAKALPIGRVTEWEKGDVKGRPALLETITYLEEGVSEAAEAIWKMVSAGVIKAVSVGFLPIKSVWPESDEERQALGLGEMGVLFEKQEQMELSNCTVPANPSALATRAVRTALTDMVREGQITEKVAQQLVDLGEHRTIQVSVPEMPATETSGTSNVSELGFFIVRDGKAVRVKVGEEEEPEPKADQPDERIDELLAEVRMLREELAETRKELAEMPARLDEAVQRTLRQQREAERNSTDMAKAKINRAFAVVAGQVGQE